MRLVVTKSAITPGFLELSCVFLKNHSQLRWHNWDPCYPGQDEDLQEPGGIRVWSLSKTSKFQDHHGETPARVHCHMYHQWWSLAAAWELFPGSPNSPAMDREKQHMPVSLFLSTITRPAQSAETILWRPWHKTIFSKHQQNTRVTFWVLDKHLESMKHLVPL